MKKFYALPILSFLNYFIPALKKSCRLPFILLPLMLVLASGLVTNTAKAQCPNTTTDTDGDGIPDYLDLDDDNDGILDVNEGTKSVFNYTGAQQTATAPAHAIGMRVKIWGAGGAHEIIMKNVPAGIGGYTYAEFGSTVVTPNAKFAVVVGAGGGRNGRVTTVAGGQGVAVGLYGFGGAGQHDQGGGLGGIFTGVGTVANDLASRNRALAIAGGGGGMDHNGECGANTAYSTGFNGNTPTSGTGVNAVVMTGTTNYQVDGTGGCVGQYPEIFTSAGGGGFNGGGGLSTGSSQGAYSCITSGIGPFSGNGGSGFVATTALCNSIEYIVNQLLGAAPPTLSPPNTNDVDYGNGINGIPVGTAGTTNSTTCNGVIGAGTYGAGGDALVVIYWIIDTDGDGISDDKDTDSDADGCPDAIEGDGTFKWSNINSNNQLTGTIGTNGVPNIAGAGQAGGSWRNNAIQDVDCIKAINPDLNSGFTSQTLSGNLHTNNDVPVGTTYGTAVVPVGITNPGTEIPVVNTDGTYTFIGATLGVYTFNVPVCPPGIATNCPINKLTITLATINTTQINVNCFGSSTGNATATASGGTAPYSYSWNTVPVQNTATATGLVAGTYTVTVTDAGGNIGSRVVTITQPTVALSASYTTTNVSCFNGSNGAIDLSVTGGTAPYAYAWTINGGSAIIRFTEDLTGIAAGSYSVTITDANNCTTTQTVNITQPANPIGVVVTSQPVHCPGESNGIIDLTSLSGGTAPYTFAWTASNGGVIPPGQATNQNLTGLTQGNYSVTITDSNGCTGQFNIPVNQFNAAPFATPNIRSVVEDTPINVSTSAPASPNNLLTNDSDSSPSDKAALIITGFTIAGEAGSPLHAVANPYLIANVGTITINANGSYAFSPVLNYNGNVPIITYTIADPCGATSSSTLTIILDAVNDAPALNTPSFNVQEDTPKAYVVPAILSDVDGGMGNFTFTMSIPAGKGTFAASSTAGVTVTNSGTNAVTFEGTIADINAFFANAATAPVFTQGDPDVNTTTCGIPIIVLTNTVSDNGNTGTGGAKTDLQTRQIAISPVIDIVADNVTTCQNIPSTFNVITGNNTRNNANNANGADNFETTPAATVTLTAINGAVVSNPIAISGGQLNVNATGDITFTPTAGFSGSTNFTYTVTPGVGCPETASVTINVIAAPATPAVNVTQPTCTVATGIIEITAPLSANFEYSKDGGLTFQASATFNNVSPGTYQIVARNTATQCTSVASASVTVNAQPATPAQPTLGAVAQPTCATATGSFAITNYDPAYTYTVSPSIGVTITGNTITAP
ncbi:S-layer family protein, partial [Pedobacter sp. Hv1]|uniref:beta strand repeat-containing protein n=1 Tax=Pedobacter sp. Hv1 TaxID=1740090 RepID=UPI00128F7D17